MTERKVCTIELTEQEAIGLLERARRGQILGNAFDLSMPEGVAEHDADRAERKLTQAIKIESGDGGSFETPPADFVTDWHSP